MTDLQVKNGKVAYLDDNGNTVYELPTSDYTLDEVLSRGDSSTQDITVGNITANTTGYIQLPVGNDSDQRPVSPTEGMMRYNNVGKYLEFYNGTSWLSINPAITSIEYVTANFRYNGQDGSQSTANIALPSNITTGDWLLLAVWSDTITNQTTPTGWTLVGNGNDTEYPKSYVYAKLAEASDASSTVSVSFSGSVDWASIAAVYRPNNPIGSFATSNFANTKGPNALSITLNATGVSKPAIAIAVLTGRGGPQDPTLTWSAKDTQVDGGSGIPSLAYNIYNTNDADAPVSHSMTTDDNGRQSLSVFYVAFT
jgi:hypothetical protein